MESTFIGIYFIIGLLFTVYNWFTYKETDYQNCINNGETPEDGMVILYMAIVMILWPIYIIYRIANKILK